MSFMFFSVNIKFLRKRKALTQEEIAQALNIKRSTLSGYENGVSQPDLANLIAFSNFFHIAIDTLIQIDLSALSDENLQFIEKGDNPYIKGSTLRVLTTTIDAENNENIELVSEKARAGYKNGFADPAYIKELPVYQMPFLSKQKKYRTFQLTGDSMLPIPDGSWVTGEYLQDWRTINTGDAYIVFTLDDGIMFKIVDNLIDSEQKLVLYSLNPLYEPYEVHINEVKEVWKFTHYISEELPEPVLPSDELTNTVAKVKHELDIVKRMVYKRAKS
jgi:transcriptional regulator with XRE-family HTH domain